MKKNLKVLIIGLAMSLMLSACDNSQNADDSNKNTQMEVSVDESITGPISMNGSTSMEKLSNSLNEVFQLKYPKTTPTVQFTGSSAGIEAVSNKTSDIGNSSRALKDSELAKGIVENIVALDGIAIIVDPKNKVENLTTQQLLDIYTGKIKNWQELGGENQGIVVIGREAGSGTRGAFEEIVGLENPKYSQEIESTGAVVGKVSTIPGAIGYVSLDVVNEMVKTVSIDDIQPTEQNIKNGTYILSRPFVMATNGEISEQSPQVQKYFEFIYSDEGKQIIEQVGLVPVN